MPRREYVFRRGLKWQLWENIAMMAALPTIILVVGLASGVDPVGTLVFALVLAAIAAFIAWDRLWIFRNFAQRVVIDDAGIEAMPFYGDSVRMAWDEISVREESERRDPFRGSFAQMRLIGSDPRSRIVLDGEMASSEELMREVRTRTAHAAPGPERSWWERVFLPG